MCMFNNYLQHIVCIQSRILAIVKVVEKTTTTTNFGEQIFAIKFFPDRKKTHIFFYFFQFSQYAFINPAAIRTKKQKMVLYNYKNCYGRTNA